MTNGSPAARRTGVRRARSAALVFVGSLAYFGCGYARRLDRAGDAGARLAARRSSTSCSSPSFALHHSLVRADRCASAGSRAWCRPRSSDRSTSGSPACCSSRSARCWQPVPGVAVARRRAGRLRRLRGAFRRWRPSDVVAARHLDVLELAGVRQVSLGAERGGRVQLDRSRPVRPRPASHLPRLVADGLVSAGDERHAPGVRGHQLRSTWRWPCPFEERDLRRTFGARMTLQRASDGDSAGRVLNRKSSRPMCSGLPCPMSKCTDREGALPVMVLF